MPEVERRDDKVNVVGLLALFGVMGLFRLAGGLLMLAMNDRRQTWSPCRSGGCQIQPVGACLVYNRLRWDDSHRRL
jgi:hypothetical protein